MNDSSDADKDMKEELERIADEEDIKLDEDLKQITEKDYDLDPEYQIDENVKRLFDEQERKILENKLDSLARLNQYTQFDTEGHDLHHAWAFSAGAGLTTFAFIYQNGAALGLALLGLAMTLIDIQKLLNSDETKRNKMVRLIQNHPVYYILGILAASIVSMNAGLDIPQVEFGLLASIITALAGL